MKFAMNIREGLNCNSTDTERNKELLISSGGEKSEHFHDNYCKNSPLQLSCAER